jgi:hypothetical protein
MTDDADLSAPTGPAPTPDDPAIRQRRANARFGTASHGERHAALGTTGWLRPFVLGAEDGVVSTAGLVIGVAAAGGNTAAVVAAGVAGGVSGALSMAAGEYVSVVRSATPRTPTSPARRGSSPTRPTRSSTSLPASTSPVAWSPSSPARSPCS